ncbi:uncharacterized protein LOC143286021 [Babylonia areolata]|uniref:uncharacterized protein LOC143286021 n=1 Tax=Babylonia areolata TaxID=304850 RepID=UPI003FD32569
MATRTPQTTVKDYLQSVNTENEVHRAKRRRSVAGDSEGGDSVPESASKQQRKRMEAQSPRTRNSVRAAGRSEEEVTPRHIIQNMLTMQGTAQPVTRKRKRMSDVGMPPPSSSRGRKTARRRSSVSAVDLDDVTRRFTPRTNIVGFLEQAPEETPAVRKSSTATDALSTTHNVSSLMINEVGVSLLENRSASGNNTAVKEPASGGRFRGKKRKFNITLPQISPAASPSQVQQTPEYSRDSRTSTPIKDVTATTDDNANNTATPDPVPPASPLSGADKDEQDVGVAGETDGADSSEHGLDRSGTSERDRSKGSERNVFYDVFGEIDVRDATADNENAVEVEEEVEMHTQSSRLETERVQGGYKAQTLSVVLSSCDDEAETLLSGRRNDEAETLLSGRRNEEAEIAETPSSGRRNDEAETEDTPSSGRKSDKAETRSSRRRSDEAETDETPSSGRGNDQAETAETPSSGRKSEKAETRSSRRRSDIAETAETPSSGRKSDRAETRSSRRRSDRAETLPSGRRNGEAETETPPSGRRNDKTQTPSSRTRNSKAQTPSTAPPSSAGRRRRSRRSDSSSAQSPTEKPHQDGSGEGRQALSQTTLTQFTQSLSRVATPSGVAGDPTANPGSRKKTPRASTPVSNSRSTLHSSSRRRTALSLSAPGEAVVDASGSLSGKESGLADGSRIGEQVLGDGGDDGASSQMPSLSSAVERLSSRLERPESTQSPVRGEEEAEDEGAEDAHTEEDNNAGASVSAETALMPDLIHGPSDQEEEDSEEEGYSPLKTPHLPEKQGTPNTPFSRPGGRTQSEGDTQQASTSGVRRKAGASSRSRKKPRTGLPSSVVKATFSHFCRMRVTKEAIEEVEKLSEQYWQNLAEDLEANARHAHRQTITEADVELLMKRQGFITDTCSLNTLIAKYLPLELRQELIPIARSGNKLEPKT